MEAEERNKKIQKSLFSVYSKRYVTSETKTAGGKRRSVDKGDRLAQLLRGKSVEDLLKVARENGIQAERWVHLNPGRFRMQVGRALRMIMRTGVSLIVDGKKVDKL